MAPRRINRRLLLTAAALTVLVAIVLVAAFDPTGSRYYPKCMLYVWTGLYCPGCGGLRTVHNLAHGRLQAALAMNPLVVCLVPALVAAVVYKKFHWPLFSQPTRAFVFRYVGWFVAAVLIGFAVLRNIPCIRSLYWHRMYFDGGECC